MKEDYRRCNYPRLSNIYDMMKKRCNNPNYSQYCDYGGRGIKICNEWENSFSDFCKWSLSHGYSDDLTIDRINNNCGYNPDNCRWVDRATQNKNKRSNIMITYKGKTQCISDWAIELNKDRKHISRRYRETNGENPEYILFGKNQRLILTYQNQTKFVADWCKELELNYKVVYKRFKKWNNATPEEILFGKEKE